MPALRSSRGLNSPRAGQMRALCLRMVLTIWSTVWLAGTVVMHDAGVISSDTSVERLRPAESSGSFMKKSRSVSMPASFVSARRACMCARPYMRVASVWHPRAPSMTTSELRRPLIMSMAARKADAAGAVFCAAAGRSSCSAGSVKLNCGSAAIAS